MQEVILFVSSSCRAAIAREKIGSIILLIFWYSNECIVFGFNGFIFFNENKKRNSKINLEFYNKRLAISTLI